MKVNYFIKMIYFYKKKVCLYIVCFVFLLLLINDVNIVNEVLRI